MRLLFFCALASVFVPLAASAQDAAPYAPPVSSPDPQAPATGYAPVAAPAAPVPAPPTPIVVPVQPAPSVPPPAPVPGYPAPAVYAPPPAPSYYVPALTPVAPPAPALAVPPTLYVTAPCLESSTGNRPVLPPGYVIAASHVILATPTLQGPVSARYEHLNAELARVDERLADLQNERIKLGAPITMMVLGYGTALVSSLVALSAYSSAQDIQHHRSNIDHGHDINHDGSVNGHDEQQYRRYAYGFTALAGFGAMVGLLSTAGLVRRKAQRRAQASERKELLGQRERLRKQLDYGLSASPQQLQLSVQGQF
jgi:hypothetical protein